MPFNSTTASISSVAAVLSTALIAGAIAFVAFLYFNHQEVQMRYDEIDDCIQASSMVTEHAAGERVATTTEPIRNIYQSCLQDKGISVGNE